MRPIHLTLGALFICLMAIGGNITVWFPFLAIPIGGTSVPLSLQTFFAILAGFILGKRISTLSMFIYTFLGFIGIPIRSEEHTSELQSRGHLVCRLLPEKKQ